MSIPPANVTVNNFKYEFKNRDRFNGQNFDIWVVRVRSILQELEIWGHVDGTVPKPPDTKSDVVKLDWLSKDRRARNVIQAALDSSMMFHAMTATSSKDIWDSLCQVHQKKSVSSLVNATRDFYNYKMRESSPALLVVYLCASPIDKFSWYLDSGATTHVC